MNLLLVAMVVMICYAMAGVMVATLDLGSLLGEHAFAVALFAVILFVFAYTLFGGTFAHAYTNTVQGGIMVVVALLLVSSGAEYWGDGFFAKLAAIDPALAAPVNPGSLLFRNIFEVFVANFAVGLALAVQPHFVIKSLYVKSDRDVNVYLAIAIVCGVLFNLVMLCGLYARLGPSAEIEAFARASGLGIDGIMPAYVVQTFSPAVGAIVSIALLAAGMSTLDGILVAISAIFANDIVLALRRRDASTTERDLQLGFRAGRWSLIALGCVSFVLGMMQHASKEFSIAIFAQEGIYALFAATFAPVLLGMFAKSPPPARVALLSSVTALLVHFGMRYGKLSLVTGADWTNPGLTATFALAASVAVVGVWYAFHRESKIVK
ncbi:MAG: sodium:solute symporter [Acidobacteria bacterium]|nr:sodium:solute symporter [Acidobacteriota bacterium]